MGGSDKFSLMAVLLSALRVLKGLPVGEGSVTQDALKGIFGF